jgi:hypothetical protein
MNNSNIVTQRFAKCVNRLRENKTIKSSRQFATEIACLPQTLSEILNGRRDATIDVIRRAVERHLFNPIYLFTGEGDMFMTPKATEVSENDAIDTPNADVSNIFPTEDDAHTLMMLEIKDLKSMMSDLHQKMAQLVENA